MGITVAFIYFPLLILFSVKGYKLSNKIGSNINKNSHFKLFYILGVLLSMAMTVTLSSLITDIRTGPIPQILGYTLPSLIVPFFVGTLFYWAGRRLKNRLGIKLMSIAIGTFGTVWALPLLIIFWYSHLSNLVNDVSKYF